MKIQCKNCNTIISPGKFEEIVKCKCKSIGLLNLISICLLGDPDKVIFLEEDKTSDSLNR